MKLIEIITTELKLDKDKSELKLESILQNSDDVEEKIVRVKNAIKDYRDSVYNFKFWTEFVEARVVHPEQLEELEEEKK